MTTVSFAFQLYSLFYFFVYEFNFYTYESGITKYSCICLHTHQTVLSVIALYSRIIPDYAQGIMNDARDGTWDDHIQDKCLILCSTSPAHTFYF